MATAPPPGGGIPRPASAGNLHRVPSNHLLQQQAQQQPPGTAATVVMMKVDPATGTAQPAQVLQPAMLAPIATAGAATAAGLPPGIPPGAVAIAVQPMLQPAPPQAQQQAAPPQPPSTSASQSMYQPVAPAEGGGAAAGGGGMGGADAAAAAAAAAALAGGGAGGQVGTLPQAFEKKLRRLEKNRESARECRRRKKEHVMELQKEVAHLEAENLKLKLQLKVGEESERQERQEKARVTKKLEEMVKSGASEADIWQTIDMFKERYSDYGSDRRSAIEFHTNQLEKLLLPTKLTKLCMWMLLHVNADPAASASASASASAASTSGTSSSSLAEAAAAGGAGGGGDAAMPPPAPAAAAAAQPGGGGDGGAAGQIWATLVGELGVTEEQQRALLAQRGTIEGMERDLKVTSGMLDELRALIDDKNSSLDQELLEVQKILSPTQTAKFILWITQNPACMHMLNQLWRYVYERSPGGGGKLPASSASSAASASAAAPAAVASAGGGGGGGGSSGESSSGSSVGGGGGAS